MTDVAATQGLILRERSFGDTMSFELYRENVKEFSFQIAVRSITLEEPIASAWPPILIETFHDNIASKMNALVNRGAPRDLLDIKHVIDEGRLSPQDAWMLWANKNPGQPVESAKQKVLLSLEVLEARRPLRGIEDFGERGRAKELREWYRLRFLESE